MCLFLPPDHQKKFGRWLVSHVLYLTDMNFRDVPWFPRLSEIRLLNYSMLSSEKLVNSTLSAEMCSRACIATGLRSKVIFGSSVTVMLFSSDRPPHLSRTNHFGMKGVCAGTNPMTIRRCVQNQVPFKLKFLIFHRFF